MNQHRNDHIARPNILFLVFFFVLCMVFTTLSCLKNCSAWLEENIGERWKQGIWNLLVTLRCGRQMPKQLLAIFSRYILYRNTYVPVKMSTDPLKNTFYRILFISLSQHSIICHLQTWLTLEFSNFSFMFFSKFRFLCLFCKSLQRGLIKI